SHSDIQVEPVIKWSRFKKKNTLADFLPQKECQLWSGLFRRSQPGDIYHGPDFKISGSFRGPKIVTVHDMVVFEQKYNAPSFYQKGIRDLTKVLQSSSVQAVIANSHFTKSEILRHFPLLQGRVHVTHLGCDRFAMRSSVSSLALPEKYILFVGTLEKRKNIQRLIAAFEMLKEQGCSEELVLAGGWGFGAEEIRQQLETSRFRSSIHHLNYVSQEHLAELYQRARVFFFPSLYEGFGIPALEAMQAGCPVVVSQGGALEEICGQAALTVNALDVEAMAATVKQLLLSEDLREEMSRRGQEQACLYTWENCARDTIAVYKQVLGSL
ncbi:MAG: glycosyltransferase family 1 protein, partial [Bdellovibrio sp.]